MYGHDADGGNDSVINVLPFQSEIRHTFPVSCYTHFFIINSQYQYTCMRVGMKEKKGKEENRRRRGWVKGREREYQSLYLSLYDSVFLCFPLLRMLLIVGI
jgi:hypothetical protein